MSSLDGATPRELAICTKTGSITTTTGVLFMKADASTTMARIPASAARGLLPTCACACEVTASSAPVRTSAPTTRNIAAMVQGAGLDSTSSAAS